MGAIGVAWQIRKSATGGSLYTGMNGIWLLNEDSRTIESPQQTLESFLHCLGRLPERAPLEPELMRVRKHEGMVCEKVSFLSFAGCRVVGEVWRQEGQTGSLPALLAIHGHGGNYVQGKSKLIERRRGNPTYGYGVKLIRAGFVLMAIDLLGFEERRIAPLVSGVPWEKDMERMLFGNLLLQGFTLAGMNLFELSRAIDYLSSRLDLIDVNRIGVVGHSMGGTLAPLLMLFDHRIKVGVSAAGVSTWRSMIEKQVIHNFGVYIPGLLQIADMDRLLSHLAPRPFLLIAGERDQNFPVEGVQDVVSAMRENYEKTGARPGAFEWHIHPGGHPFEEVQQEKMLTFLGKWL